jgi:pyruvate/2-oxoglutarate dehydrogenase complex dihydrolipoamide dehydrogenase (E3) component
MPIKTPSAPSGVVGGSYVELEFVQIYRRFGSEVSVVEKATRLIAREDEDVSAA